MHNRIPLEKLLDQAGNLPPMPRAAQRAMEIIRDPNYDMAQLAQVIKLDQAMSGLILRWVNSGYFSLRNQITSIEQAVAYLGQRAVQDMLLSASVAEYMNKPVPGYALERGDLWKHSVGMAAGARLIVKDIEPKWMEEAYYCGLFADVGKLAFDLMLRNLNFDPNMLGNYTFDTVETSLFGYDHPTVGAAMVRRWKLSEAVACAIQNHHTPANSPADCRVLAYAVHAADAVMNMFGVGIGRDGLHYQLDQQTPAVLHWNEKSLERMYDMVIPMVQEAERFLERK